MGIGQTRRAKHGVCHANSNALGRARVYDSALALVLGLRHEARCGSAGRQCGRSPKNLPYIHAGETPALPVRVRFTKDLSYTRRVRRPLSGEDLRR